MIMSDCKALIDMINKRIDPVLEVGGFVEDIWCMSLSFVSCAVHFTRRE